MTSVLVETMNYAGSGDSAVMSDDGLYRYELRRRLSPKGEARSIAWCMCNPSTADHRTDDPTIKKIMKYSRLWGFTDLVVVNVYAFRSTNPGKMLYERKLGVNIIGPDNARFQDLNLKAADVRVAAWGRNVRAEDARDLSEMWSWTCLATNADGSPVHPLYQPDNTELKPWVPA